MQEERITTRCSAEDGRFLLRFDAPCSGLAFTPDEARELIGKLSTFLDLAASVASRAGMEPVRLVSDSQRLMSRLVEARKYVNDGPWLSELVRDEDRCSSNMQENEDRRRHLRELDEEIAALAAVVPAAPAEASEDEQRKSFEHRARKSGYSLLRDGDEYRHPPTQHAWQGWMMGAEAKDAVRSEPVAAPVEVSRLAAEPKPDFCPHAHPFVYCETCYVNPCPLGLGEKK